MQRALRAVALAAVANVSISFAAIAQTAPEMTLTRLDCGTPQAPVDVGQRFTDTFAYKDLKLQFVYSCYLVKHGSEYMLWDTGQPMNSAPVAPKVSVVDQLAQLQVKPEQIKYVGISHYHGDHTGQVGSFPQARLLIGKADWEAVSNAKPGGPINPAPFTHWISGGGTVEPLPVDKDVFGDGTVVVLNTPGHTPGHHSLLVRLHDMGPVLVTGDAVHFHENYDSDGVPHFNPDRAATLASISRLKKIAANLKATVIIQHDARDVNKLPAFPAGAK